ncbi:MAG: DNA gyrase subunit A, partial [Synergistaceae bacterium]|nr:DNA gyrase subunit A [Synergistaceae bacterium]
QANLSDIMQRLPGPDFPTGGQIMSRAGIIEAYKTGRGKIIIRGKMHTEEGKRGRNSIIITEIPYAVNKSLLIESMVNAVNNKEIDGISELRDESDRDGMRIVLDLTRDADPELIMRQLYKKTALQSTFGVINIALVDKRPQILPLAAILKAFIDYRREVVRRRTNFRLKQASAREHIVTGLIKALDNIDNIIDFIRAAKTAQEARDNLVKNNFSDLQAQAILDMRLQRLTGLERDKLSEEKANLLLSIANFNNILNNPDVLDGVIHDELKDLGARFGDERRTEIIDFYEEIADEDMIPNIDIVVTLSRDGFLKRQDLASYALQGRGGKGRKGASVQAEDAIAAVCVANTINDLYFFTNKGRVMTLKGYVIPETRTGKGKQIARLLPLEEGENVVTLASGVSSGWEYAFFITKNAVAKRVTVKDLTENNRPKRVIMLDPGDEIAQICLTSGEDDLLLVTQEAKALRVSEKEFRPLSRTARGVTAMKLGMNDRILSCSVVKPDEQVLFLSERGLGKRTRFDEFTVHH